MYFFILLSMTTCWIESCYQHVPCSEFDYCSITHYTFDHSIQLNYLRNLHAYTSTPAPTFLHILQRHIPTYTIHTMYSLRTNYMEHYTLSFHCIMLFSHVLCWGLWKISFWWLAVFFLSYCIWSFHFIFGCEWFLHICALHVRDSNKQIQTK